MLYLLYTTRNKISAYPQWNSGTCIMETFSWGILITLHIPLGVCRWFCWGGVLYCYLSNQFNLDILLVRFIPICPHSSCSAKRAVSFEQILLCAYKVFLMLSCITKFCVFFSCSLLSISLLAFSPVHHSGAAPTHWLKPFCSQVILFFFLTFIFPLVTSSKIVWLTVLFDSIAVRLF